MVLKNLLIVKHVLTRNLIIVFHMSYYLLTWESFHREDLDNKWKADINTNLERKVLFDDVVEGGVNSQPLLMVH